MHTFEDVLVTPYIRLIHQGTGGHVGGPVWPNWSRQTEARFCRQGVPVDARPPLVPPVQAVRDRDAVWIGPIIDHFGHGIADASTRILGSLAERPGALLVFAGHAGKPLRELEATPSWFRQMLAWYGVDPARVRIVDRPTHFRTLCVVPQGEQLLGPPPTEAYLDQLTQNAARHFGRPQQRATLVYVSRAGLTNTFAGERYLEALLAPSSRVVVKRPETVPLTEQLRAYHGARRLIFAEGSALHGLQLLGGGLGQVDVINRRPGRRICEDGLIPRCASVRYHDYTRGLVVGADKNGQALRHAGMSVLAADGIAEFVASLGLEPEIKVDKPTFDAAVDADLVDWLHNTRHVHALRQASCRELIVKSLRRVGRAHLVPQAEAVFASAT